MSWKCVCKEENNSDESTVCKKCGRSKPKYLGIKLVLSPTEKMSPEQLAVWYLMIAHDHLLDSEISLNHDAELSEKLGNQNYDQVNLKLRINEYRDKVESYCEKCQKILEKVKALSPAAQFEDEKGFIHSISSIKSDCYFNLGSLQFRQNNWAKAIEYYQSSYEADPNQVAIYNIAMATMNLPAEGGGLFGGAKKQAALETKREQEIELLKKTIRFAPFSELGIKSGRILINKYKMIDLNL